jgi:hypothetical protein
LRKGSLPDKIIWQGQQPLFAPSFDHYIMIQGGISDMKRMIIVVSAIAAIAAIAITTISVPDRFE